MKTNQIFNFSRFGRYAKSSLIINYRQLLMIWGGMVSAIFLLYLLVKISINNAIRGEAMTEPFLILFFAAGIIFAGTSFPAFRKKEKAIAALTIPVSALERFVYEFLEKIVVFIIFYPPIFYVASNSALYIRNTINWRKSEIVEYTANGVVSKVQVFPHHYFSLTDVAHEFKDGQLPIYLSLAFLLFSIAFAGAATFRKYPLVKMIVFCGAFIAAMAGYFYITFEKLHLNHPWLEKVLDQIDRPDQVFFWTYPLTFVSLMILPYSYFKIKEKEVQ